MNTFQLRLPAMVLAWYLIALMPIGAAVDVIRTPSDSPTNRAEAGWSEPYVLPGEVRELIPEQPGEISGRLKAGGSAEMDGGIMGYDAVIDSLFSYTRQGTGDFTSNLSAQAYRRNSIESTEEQYQVRGGLSSGKLLFDLSGNYGSTDQVVADIERYDRSMTLASTLTALMIPTLPVTLSYELDWDRRDEASNATMDLLQHELELSAYGTLGSTGMELEGHFHTDEDQVTLTRSQSGAGAVLVSVPATEVISLLVGAQGNYSTTQYTTGNGTSFLSTGASLGGIVTPDLGENNELEMSFAARRDDSFPTQEGPDADPSLDDHIATWNGELKGSWSSARGFHTDPLYQIAWSDTGVWTHNAGVTAGWTAPEDTVIQQMETQGRLVVSVDENGRTLNDEKVWAANLSLSPLEESILSADYTGTHRTGEDSDFLSHSGGVDWLHIPHRILDYGAGVRLNASLDESSLTRLSQTFTSSVSLKPQLPTGTMITSLQEVFNIVHRPDDDELNSRLQWNVDVPFGGLLSAGYGLGWEWMNLETHDHAFSHNGRLSVSGDEIPLNLTLSYAFSHGYLGIRHDAESLIFIPLRGGYSLENRFTISNYQEEGQGQTPFLMEISVIYVF